MDKDIFANVIANWVVMSRLSSYSHLNRKIIVIFFGDTVTLISRVNLGKMPNIII